MVRNRKALREAMAWRCWIFALHAARTQAEPPLTLNEIRAQCGEQLSRTTIKRHLAWLRAHEYLGRWGPFFRPEHSVLIVPHGNRLHLSTEPPGTETQRGREARSEISQQLRPATSRALRRGARAARARRQPAEGFQ
jgi:hypothetical protein